MKEVTGLEEMQEQLREAMGPQGDPMTDQLFDQMFSEDGVKSMFGRGIATFPPEPLQTGDGWEASFDFAVPMFGTMTSTSIMTLGAVETRGGERIALIDTAGDMLFTPDGTGDSPMAASMRMGDAEISGTMEWSVDRGLRPVSDARTIMQMDVTAGAQQITVVTTMDVRMELVEGSSLALALVWGPLPLEAQVAIATALRPGLEGIASPLFLGPQGVKFFERAAAHRSLDPFQDRTHIRPLL